MNKPFAFNGRTWQWLQIGQSWELRTGGRAVARVVPDVVYPMYRVERDGELSDMANLTRLKDAALSLADRALEARARPVRRSPVRRNEKGATRHWSPEKLTSDGARLAEQPWSISTKAARYCAPL